MTMTSPIKTFTVK